MSIITLSTSKVRWLEKGAGNCVVLATLRTYVHMYVRMHIGTWLPRPDPGFLCIMGHCLSLRIMVPLEKMQTNHSVPCHKGDGDNTLATKYNHKKYLLMIHIGFFHNLKKYLTLSPPIEIIPYTTSLFVIFFCAPVLNILICL